MEIKNLESSIVANTSELKGLQRELSRQTEIIYNVVSKILFFRPIVLFLEPKKYTYFLGQNCIFLGPEK